MNAFSKFVRSSPPMTPALPLAHTCEGYYFREIIHCQQLRPSFCEHFKEDLLFFFYGRPAYQPNCPGRPTSISAYYPVCFLLREDAATTPKRIAPFDTGAFFGLSRDLLGFFHWAG